MGRTEREFLAAADTAGYALEHGGSVPWLTTHGHLHPGLAQTVPPAVIESLRTIFLALGGREDLLAAKRNSRLQLDAFLNGQILEIDEIQHFSTARRRALKLYPTDCAVGFDLGEYRTLCTRWAPRGGDRYRAAKQTRDFPHQGGRTAQRAYFDALRDLLAPHLGNGPVVRIAAPECDAGIALKRLRARVTA